MKGRASTRRREVAVRAARPGEVDRLTAIALAAKAHWGYPAAWLELWRPSLTFDEALLRREWVRVAEVDGVVRGVVALAEGGELSHLWVEPEAMGGGLGRSLLAAAKAEARRLALSEITIVSDPHAVAFYERHGARVIGEEPSTPEGRMLPVLTLDPWPAPVREVES